jgi:hypothetical protein
MELTINIDEAKFNELIQGELNNFSEQELHEICREGFMKCLSNVDTFKTLFVERDSSYYNTYSEKYYAKDLLKEAAKKVDLDPLFKDFQDQVVKYLKDNHDNIIKELMKDIFVAGLSNALYSSDLTNRIRGEFAMQLESMRNQTEQKIHNAINSLH